MKCIVVDVTFFLISSGSDMSSSFVAGFTSQEPFIRLIIGLKPFCNNFFLSICLEYMSDNRDRRPRVLFSEKKKEMNADVPESRKLRNGWAQTVFLFVPPRWHVNLLSKVHQSMQKHHTELVNKTGPHLSEVTSPLLRDWGWKLDKMKKWSLFW